MDNPYIGILGIIIICVVAALFVRTYFRVKKLKAVDDHKKYVTFLAMREFAYSDMTLDKLLDLFRTSPSPVQDAITAIKAGDVQKARVLLSEVSEPKDVLYHMAQAKVAQAEGDIAGAREVVLSILRPDEESRAQISAWAVLRELGHSPSPQEADKVLGVVTEFVLGKQVILLSAYSDGDARLLTSGGFGMVGMMQQHQGISEAATALVKAAQPLVGSLPVNDSRPMPDPGRFRVTILTPGGMHISDEAISEVATPAHKLYPIWSATQSLLTNFRLVGESMGIGEEVS